MAICSKCNQEIENLVFVTIFESDFYLKEKKNGSTILIMDRNQNFKSRYECPLCGKKVADDQAGATTVLQA